MATHTPDDRWAVDYRHFGIVKRRGSFGTRRAAETAAAKIYQTPGVTQVSVVRLGWSAVGLQAWDIGGPTL